MQKKYLRMLAGMIADVESGPAEWSVYILTCGDGSLYTGIAKNVAKRLLSHQSGRGAAYTRTHLPVTLVYEESALTRSQALVREAAIKRLPRDGKLQLIIKHKGDSHGSTSARQPHPRRRRGHREGSENEN